MTDFDKEYSDIPDLFGTGPSSLLERYGEQIVQGGRVLDVGVGQGRNAFSMARQGYKVTGIDTSTVALEQTKQQAEQEDVSLDLEHVSYLDYEPDEPFDAVLCFGLLQILPRTLGASLLHRLRMWTRPGGMMFLTAWHVDEPTYNQVRETWDQVSRHSFRSPEGEYRTFLARDEVMDLMTGWNLVHHWEGTGPEHRHGDGPLQKHGLVEVVAVKRS